MHIAFVVMVNGWLVRCMHCMLGWGIVCVCCVVCVCVVLCMCVLCVCVLCCVCVCCVCVCVVLVDWRDVAQERAAWSGVVKMMTRKMNDRLEASEKEGKRVYPREG